MVPVIDVKRDWHDLFPKIGIALQLAEPFFRGRTTAAAFRGEEFQQVRSRLAGENQVTGLRVQRRCKTSQEKEEKQRCTAAHSVNKSATTQ